MDAGYNTMKQYIEGSHNEHDFSNDIAIAIVYLLLFLHMPLNQRAQDERHKHTGTELGWFHKGE